MDAAEICWCPICARTFDRDALNKGLLSLEDVPPKSVGGKPICLTCTECNSTAGHSYDFAPAEHGKIAQLGNALVQSKGSFEGLVTLTVGGHSVRGIATIDEAGVKFRGLPENNNPADIEGQNRHFQKLVDEASTDAQFNLSATFKGTKRQAFVSNLRAAFLTAFALLGYRFALHPSLEIVRRQIMEPESELIPRTASINFDGGEYGRVPMVYTIDKPCDAIGVQVPGVGGILIILPVPSLPVENFYSTLAAHYEPDGTVGLHLESIGWPVGPDLKLDFQEWK